MPTYAELLESYKISLGYYTDLLKENEFLNKTYKVNTDDIITNNRKTFYENQYIESCDEWFRFFTFVYYFFVVIFVWLTFVVEIDKSIFKSGLQCCFLGIFPYLTVYFSQIIVGIILYLFNLSYFNPYLNIKSNDTLPEFLS
jgi:hypothetical protein